MGERRTKSMTRPPNEAKIDIAPAYDTDRLVERGCLHSLARPDPSMDTQPPGGWGHPKHEMTRAPLDFVWAFAVGVVIGSSVTALGFVMVDFRRPPKMVEPESLRDPDQPTPPKPA
jgi:hypothetical protein